MAHCTSCGTQLAEKARFCSQCGTAVDASAQTATAAAPQGGNHQGAAGAAADSQRPADPSATIWTGWPSRKRHIPMLAVSALLIAVGLIGMAVSPPLGIIAAIGGLGALWTAGRMLLEPLMLRYWLTSDRLFVRRGLLRVTTDQTELIRVDDITVQQGIIDRVFGIGTVTVMCASDKSDGMIPLFGIDQPMRVSELIRTGMQTLRRKGGMFIEQV